MKVEERIQNKIAELNAKLLFIHSDVSQGFKIPFISREALLRDHVSALLNLGKGINIWMPAFNYSFCRGMDFSIKDTPSQVGSISEYFRREIANWRTNTPVFSFSGNGDNPNLTNSEIIDPFSSNSGFHLLNTEDAILMHYGSELKHTTILHYVERMSEKLIYRYNKIFTGKIINQQGISNQVKLLYHVRPMGHHLDYDWDKLKIELENNKILFEFTEGNTRILLIKIKELVSFWINKMQDNNLYLLDQKSIAWIKPKLDQLGRPFLISDFE